MKRDRDKDPWPGDDVPRWWEDLPVFVGIAAALLSIVLVAVWLL